MVWNRKKYFEIFALLNFKRGTSRVGNSNETKTQTVAAKGNITLNFPALEFPCSIGAESCRNFTNKIPVLYPIISDHI